MKTAFSVYLYAIFDRGDGKLLGEFSIEPTGLKSDCRQGELAG